MAPDTPASTINLKEIKGHAKKDRGRIDFRLQ